VNDDIKTLLASVAVGAIVGFLMALIFAVL